MRTGQRSAPPRRALGRDAQMKNRVIIVLGSVVCATLLGLSVHYYLVARAQEALVNLLQQGNSAVSLKSIVIKNQGSDLIIIDDSESMEYLTNAFRGPKANKDLGGITR